MADTHATSAAAGSLQCLVVTPEATVREGACRFVAVPLFDGELGVARGHSPMIGRLGFGELRIEGDGGTERFYVDGGFVEVLDDVVSVLTNRALPAAQLDAEVAAQQLAAARNRKANTPELHAIRDRAQAQARAQLRIARGGQGAGGHGH
jgi:F-type H+-transporting ATPase subunit epsilon